MYGGMLGPFLARNATHTDQQRCGFSVPPQLPHYRIHDACPRALHDVTFKPLAT